MISKISQFLCGLVQMNGSNHVQENIDFVTAQIKALAAQKVQFIQLPEIANIVEKVPEKLAPLLSTQEDCPFLSAIRQEARHYKIALHIGSLALKNPHYDADKSNPIAVNRGFYINSDGTILDYYDKIHGFDVALAADENYQESAHYQMGNRKVIIDSPFGAYGMSICYDLRFPYLYREMAQQSVMMMGIPAAFTATTGRLHWEILLRARAIENSAFIMAAAQTGNHKDGRKTHGHSMVIDPDGKILADAGKAPGHMIAKIDLQKAYHARERIPAYKMNKAYH